MAELKELQARVVQQRLQRGFTTDPARIFMLLGEEIGEIAGELKRIWSPNYDPFDRDDLQDEIADAMVLLMALADQFDIDVEEAIGQKFFEKDGERAWRTANTGSAADSNPL